MQSNYNDREFEQYIKANADQYRMIPSEKVWKGINTALHTRRKWYGIGLASLLLLTGISVTWVMTSYPGSKKQANTQANNNAPSTIIRLEATTRLVSPQPITTSQPAEHPLLSLRKVNQQQQEIAGNTTTAGASTETSLTGNTEILAIEVTSPSATVINMNRTNNSIASGTKGDPSSVVNNDNTNLIAAGPLFNLNAADEKYTAGKQRGMNENSIARQHNLYSPLTIESVLNSYKPAKPKKRISWQLYVSPTISYRRLSANKAYKNSSPFAEPISYPFSSLTDVNKAVTHKPDMGLELGFSTRYPLSKSLRLRGGLQFNINRYDIKAFVYNGEQATINLSGDGNNSVTAWTYYRNYNGYKSDWLKNFYFSVSAPIGAELSLFGNNKTSFGIAGTVQPTYILSDRAYLISTDYKNYAEVPWLIRRMNVNTSFETFVNYTSRGGTKWQVGPQVRYQILSSFQNKYPVRENLFDFGLKIGVTLNQY